MASPLFAITPPSIILQISYEFAIVGVTRRSHQFAPFVRQTGEKKAQTCAIAIFHHSIAT
jgi:hypothetical protein